MANKGIKTYTAIESNNLILGQNGFDLWYYGNEPDNVEGYWIALYGLTNASSLMYNRYIKVQVETAIGNDLSDDGSTGESSLAFGIHRGNRGAAYRANASMIYGPFTKIITATFNHDGMALIAYRG